ncbi:Serpentine Receptor, class E (Epsilon) [Caenorhabditis elegans]|uniref:Serpentine Receptor, class E (Epsilon) n=1 Tax=Caenorhabditis elegans TaxID=6239 RepID=Q94403_CAEEL|nr:Serpentine Receptor, class E (Epsilon) [Caenorhabditis elegans]CAB03517.2 Serpentine Receptor, class E (Epsilon) [Caenorhabditis elegans]|eukprot:NP_492247.2 Serpentine Receptor, class E (epsilon) [Caenorhabditis elegans]
MINATEIEIREDIHADDLTVMAMFIRNSHQMPSSIGVLVQAVLFIISFIFTLIGVSTAMRFTIFHRNQRNIFISLLLLWFELLVCRVLLWAFKYNLAIEIRESIKCNDECHHFGRCSVAKNMFDSIFIAANMRYHYMYFVITTPVGILTERIFATILVKDYEKKSRHWIFGLIFVAQNIFSCTMAVVTTTSGLTFQVLISGVIFSLFCSAVIYALVEYFNQQRLMTLERDHRTTNYTLSIRYQLKENLKTLKVMRRFFISIILIIIAMGLGNSLPVILNLNEDIILTVRVYMDYVFHSNPVFLVPTAIFTIENYRKYTFNKARTTFGMRIDSRKVDIRKLRPQMDRESDMYFEIFERQLEGDGACRGKMRTGSLRKPKINAKY